MNNSLTIQSATDELGALEQRCKALKAFLKSPEARAQMQHETEKRDRCIGLVFQAVITDTAGYPREDSKALLEAVLKKHRIEVSPQMRAKYTKTTAASTRLVVSPRKDVAAAAAAA